MIDVRIEKKKKNLVSVENCFLLTNQFLISNPLSFENCFLATKKQKQLKDIFLSSSSV